LEPEPKSKAFRCLGPELKLTPEIYVPAAQPWSQGSLQMTHVTWSNKEAATTLRSGFIAFGRLQAVA